MSAESGLQRLQLLECMGVPFLFLVRIEMATAFILSHKLKFFSQFVKSWTSMEHDNNWEPKVGEKYLSFQIGFPWEESILILLKGGAYFKFLTHP